MTEHKFTDEEIIRALETIDEVGDCSRDCIFYNGKVHSCKGTVAHFALDLINRQKEEIERLTAERDAMHQDVNAAEEYAFLMRKEKDALIKTYKECTAEVVKEFAERLKIYYRNLDKTAGALVEYHIDQIAKEMLEGG